MYSDYILVIPNFSERSGVDANQLMVISDEEGLTLESAQVISAGVHAHVLSMMKTEVFDSDIDAYEIFTEYCLRDDLDTMDEFDLQELAFTLAISNIPGTRGARAVFINVKENLIYVGTAVVYNPRRATIGVTDDSVAQTILDF